MGTKWECPMTTGSCISPALWQIPEPAKAQSGHWGFPGSPVPDRGNWSYILTTSQGSFLCWGLQKSNNWFGFMWYWEYKEFDNWETEFVFIVKLLMLNMAFIFSCYISAQSIQRRIIFHDVITCMEAIVPLLMHILYIIVYNILLKAWRYK